MDHHFSSPVQPIYSNMVPESQFFSHHQGDDDTELQNAKSVLGLGNSSASHSPTTIFAVDEISSVFRVPDDAIERIGSSAADQEKASNNISRRRCLAPSITGRHPSFATDGEMSTFSEDTEESDEGSSASGDNNNGVASRLRFPIRRRRSSPLNSIFRPVVSGTKRRCEFEDQNDDDDDDDDDDDRPATPTKRCRSAPMLCHANPIRGSHDNDDGCDDNDNNATSLSIPSFSPGHSSFGESPFKRICRTSASSASSSFTSLFAEAMSATITDGQGLGEDSTVSIMPNHNYLQQPQLSFRPFPMILKARAIGDDDDGKKEDSEEC